MKENNELFTIITCTYNRGGKLNKLFDSSTKQKLFNFKCGFRSRIWTHFMYNLSD